MFSHVHDRVLERALALALAVALSWRTTGLKMIHVIQVANEIDEWLQTGKVDESNG